MMKRLVIVFVLLALAGCMPYQRQNLTSYSFAGREVKLGMSADQVREMAGAPTKRTFDEPAHLGGNTMFSNDLSLKIYMLKTYPYREYWQYGSFEDNDKEEIRITFAGGTVTGIRKCTKK